MLFEIWANMVSVVAGIALKRDAVNLYEKAEALPKGVSAYLNTSFLFLFHGPLPALSFQTAYFQAALCAASAAGVHDAHYPPLLYDCRDRVWARAVFQGAKSEAAWASNYK
mgnify:CR=1 FL=1